jgi:hypothetical protein
VYLQLFDEVANETLSAWKNFAWTLLKVHLAHRPRCSVISGLSLSSCFELAVEWLEFATIHRIQCSSVVTAV